jgi:putative phosphoesterase
LRILVVSDTHVPVLARNVPDQVLEEAQACSVILHAGDIVSSGLLDQLIGLLPTYAVHGNQDSPTVRTRLPIRRIVTLGRWRIGIVHGHEGSGMYTEDRAFNTFSLQRVDVIVFGHSHQPMNERRDGILMFNPGSPVAGRGGEGNTYGILELGESVGSRILHVTR